MAIAGITIKIMPSSPEVNLEGIKEKVKSLVEGDSGVIREVKEEPIAFGLKAVIVRFEWPEEKELESLEGRIQEIEDVNSVQVIDMRRLVE